MKLVPNLILVIFFFLVTVQLQAQTWNKIYGGLKSSNNFGKTFNQKNAEMSSRYNMGSCSAGNTVYLYGGWGLDSNGSCTVLADVWKYDGLSNKYEYLFVPSKNNDSIFPQPRSNSILFEREDNLYIMFGTGYSAKHKPDVKSDSWKFNIGTQKFEKLISPLVSPIGRYGSMSWKIGDKLFILGGITIDSFVKRSNLNDFWVYKLLENTWQKISESATHTNDKFIYNDALKERKYTQPSFESDGITWVYDEKLYYYVSVENKEYLNNSQLWEYDPFLNLWDLVAVNRTNYNQEGSAINPGFRKSSTIWVEKENIYLFGGFSYDSKSDYGICDDTWKLDMKSLTWEKLSGNQFSTSYANLDFENDNPQYRTPGARIGSAGISIQNSKHFLIGGLTADHKDLKYRNDVWLLSNLKANLTTKDSSLVLSNPVIFEDNSIQNDESECGLIISPNPFQEYMRIKASKTFKNLSVRISTQQGHVVIETMIAILENGNETQVDVSSLPGGRYIVDFISNQQKLCAESVIINLYKD